MNFARSSQHELKKASDAGNSEAMNNLGVMYYNGKFDKIQNYVGNIGDTIDFDLPY